MLLWIDNIPIARVKYGGNVYLQALKKKKNTFKNLPAHIFKTDNQIPTRSFTILKYKKREKTRSINSMLLRNVRTDVFGSRKL